MAENLDNLLDDALADFEEKPKLKKENKSKASCSKSSLNEDQAETADKVFQEFFEKDVAENLQREWESAMQELKLEDPELAEQFKNMSPPESSANDQPQSFNEALAATIAGVNQSAEDAKNMTNLPDAGNMFAEFGDMKFGDDVSDNLFTMMEGMMKTLLSKDVLYPTMQQLSTLYGPWLEKNKKDLSNPEYLRYVKQRNVMKKICSEFDNESEVDTDEVKSQRFNTIMKLVQDMQKFGDPPKELMEECGGGDNLQNIFGAQGLPPGIPSNPEELLKNEDCVVM